MKNSRHTLPVMLFLIALLSASSLKAETITAIRNGKWTSVSTWDGNKEPSDGDIVVIPAGFTVKLKNTPYAATPINDRPVLKIRISGILDFTDFGSDKLYLKEGSTIQIYAGGKIHTYSWSTEVIAISNGASDNTVWTGDPSNVTGPAFGSSTSSGFMNGILPLKLTAFEAVRLKDNSVKLSWSTSEETNTSHFEIETSTPGKPTWRYAAQVQASGNSSTNKNYFYVLPRISGEAAQFRLKQVDKDAHFTYSMIVSLVENAKNTSTLWYNQSSKTIHLENYSGKNGKIVVDVFNGNGVCCFHLEHSGSVQSIPLPTMPQGIYIVRVNDPSGNMLSRKILIR